VFEDTASALFGAEGLRVTDVQAGPGGALEAWVRIACTRSYRRRSRTATPKKTHSVTGRKPYPG